MGRKKTIFVEATKVEEPAKSNYEIPHQLEGGSGRCNLEDEFFKDSRLIEVSAANQVLRAIFV